MCTRVLVCLLALGIAGTCLGGWIVDGLPSHWEGVPVVVPADEYSYPVLVLEMGGQWTDFELKASTNNFTNLLYWVKSSGVTSGEMDDTNVWVYFTDDYSSDERVWRRKAQATGIGSQLVNATNSEVEFVAVYPSHECGVNWQEWMSRTNGRLVWSFVRYDGIDLEKNQTGTLEHWNLVVPVEWRKARLSP